LRRFFGVDLAVEGLVAGALPGDGEAGFPASVVGLGDPPGHETSSRVQPPDSVNATLRVGCDMESAWRVLVEALGDPVGDVAGAESEVAADPEAGWAVTAVSPGIDGGDRNAEVVGEILDAEEAVEGVHSRHCGR
jgi:hypothetical protein